MAKKATAKKVEAKPDPDKVGNWNALCGTLGNVPIRYNDCTAAAAEEQYRKDVKGLRNATVDVWPVEDE